MNNPIEPPVLISRLFTFVFAGALAVVLVLILAVVRLTPLTRTQVFFLTSMPHDTMEISLASVPVNDRNMAIFKESFIKEYIRARNEIIPNAAAMQRRWRADYNGTVFAWSSAEIYADFAQRRMVNALMYDMPEFEFRCSVNFGQIAPRDRTDTKFAVSFLYSCTDANGQPLRDSAGQPLRKDYTIAIRLEMRNKIKWEERLRNPLGLKVIEYTVEVGGSDPLDFEF